MIALNEKETPEKKETSVEIDLSRIEWKPQHPEVEKSMEVESQSLIKDMSVNSDEKYTSSVSHHPITDSSKRQRVESLPHQDTSDYYDDYQNNSKYETMRWQNSRWSSKFSSGKKVNIPALTLNEEVKEERKSPWENEVYTFRKPDMGGMPSDKVSSSKWDSEAKKSSKRCSSRGSMPIEPNSQNSSAAIFVKSSNMSMEGIGPDKVPEVSQISNSPMKYSEQTSQ